MNRLLMLLLLTLPLTAKEPDVRWEPFNTPSAFAEVLAPTTSAATFWQDFNWVLYTHVRGGLGTCTIEVQFASASAVGPWSTVTAVGGTSNPATCVSRQARVRYNGSVGWYRVAVTAVSGSARIYAQGHSDASTDDPTPEMLTMTSIGDFTNWTHSHQNAAGGATLDAAAIAAGTLTPARLPNPSASTLGGVRSLTCTGTDKLSSISTTGVPVCSADAGGSGSELESIVRLGADSSSGSTTLADVGLNFTAAASTDYIIEYWVIYTTAATTTGINLSVNGPASPVSVSFMRMTGLSTSVGAVSNYNAYNAGIANASALAGVNLAKLHVFFRNGTTAGTFALRFATEVSGSAVVIKAGSTVRYRVTP